MKPIGTGNILGEGNYGRANEKAEKGGGTAGLD